jgi:AAA domain
MQPDRSQIEMFVDGMFRHASPQGFVSVRAFLEGNSTKPFRISSAKLSGGLRFLVDVAEDDAYRAANYPQAVVFCPPIATFVDKEHARERDIAEGLALSVECDARPRQAREKLEALLGPATFVVRSGGKWTDPATDEVHDKLHLHWRLRTPARGDALPTLKQVRDLAARLVGGDPSNKPVCHPIRWPGSWHRKAEPIMCSIETAQPEAEIDLADAFNKLKAAPPDEPRQKANGKDHPGNGAGWAEHVASILSGEGYHDALVRLAAKMLAARMNDGAAVNLLRAIMSGSTAPRDERWESRYADIPRAVETAREKFGKAEELKAPDDDSDVWDAGDDPGVIQPRGWLSATQFCRQFLSLLIAPGGTGKTALRYLQAIELARETMDTITGFKKFQRCKVLIVGLEDGRKEMDRRIEAALIHHRIGRAEIKAHLFCWSPKGMKLAEMKGGSRQIGELERRLRGKIERLGIHLVMVDPLIKAHGLDENSNENMEFVCELLTKLSIEFNIAVDTSQHTRKGTLVAGDADNARGASATRDAGRLGYTLTTMTEDEATTFGIEPEQRRFYVRLDKAKVNIEPPAEKATSFKLVGVQLGNGNEMYPNGDEVQTVEPWSPPQVWADVSTADVNAILDEIDKGLPNGQRYLAANAASESRKASAVVKRRFPDKSDAQCRSMVKAWLESGLLYQENYDDPVDRKEKKGLFVDATKRPN